MMKTVILIGGPQHGTEFRPLSMDIPKPLCPVAGFPMIYHHIEAASKVKGMKEVIILGSYQQHDALNRFIQETQHEFKIPIRYLMEYTTLGTAGGMFHFRDQILSGSPSHLFVLNCDTCCDFPFVELLEYHNSKGSEPHFTMVGTEATKEQSLNYGCMVTNPDTQEVMHYVEKPSTFVSTTINCGIYLLTPDIFPYMAEAFRKKQEEIRLCYMYEDPYSFELENQFNKDSIMMETDLFATQLANSGKLFVYRTNKFWSQIKMPGAAVYTNRHYLRIYRRTHPERLAKNSDSGPKIIGDVFIHPSAKIHPTAVLGPNVVIDKSVTIHAGVRVRESMVLADATLQEHCCVLYSIIGSSCLIGQWARVEGTPFDPNPNKAFAKLDLKPMFTQEGKLNPCIAILGEHVIVPSEVILRNAMVMPHKELDKSCKNQISL